jgi:protein phosphatase
MGLKKAKILRLALFAKTDIGKERLINEDSVAATTIKSHSFRNDLNCGILVVADGMGGHKSGEIASEIASKSLINEVTQRIIQSSVSKENINYREILIESIEVANQNVIKLSESIADTIGTTIVAAIIIDNRIYIANVGDSRAYLVTPKKTMTQLTKDHSAVQEMLNAKIITKEQAINHPKRNLLTKALGLAKQANPDIFEADLKNKVLLLCSDGLYNMVDEKEILNAIAKKIYDSAETLISLANKNGGSDNISVALAKYQD